MLPNLVRNATSTTSQDKNIKVQRNLWNHKGSKAALWPPLIIYNNAL